MNNNNGMTEIVKTVTTLIEFAVFIYGVDIILYGHISPGGGFAGGVILAFLYILIFLAYGKEEAFKKFKISEESIFNSLGVIGLLFFISLLLFIFAHDIGYLLAKVYPHKKYQLFSGGAMMYENILIALKCGWGVFMVFAVLSVVGREKQYD
ncbi:MAG: MnhB domain-containing protein [Elusimicrobiota bacterium]